MPASTADRLLTFSLHAATDWFLPAGRTDAETLRRARLLVVSSITLAVVGCVMGTVMYFLDYEIDNYFGLYVGAALVSLNPFVLRATGSVRMPGFLLCLELVIIILLQAIFDQGINDHPVQLWGLIVPWLAAFLVGPAYGFGFAGLVSAVIGGLYWMELAGFPFPRASSAEQLQLFYLLSAPGVAFVVAYLGWLYEGHTIRNLREKNDDLQRAGEALQVSNQRIESILESITDGFFALDHFWRFTYINQRAEQLLNRERSDLLGMSARTLFRGRVGDTIFGKFSLAVQDQDAIEFEVYDPHLDVWFEVHAYPYPEGLSVYFSDITARKTYEASLIEAKERAEELAELKSAFLTNMSHEFRTPLTGILGFANTLAHELDDFHREFAELIEQNAHRLLDTLNGVLDLARLESGTVEAQVQATNLVEETDTVMRLLTPLAEGRGLTLCATYDLEQTVAHIDPLFFNRVLTNLVGNAIKFTEEGFITVRLRDHNHEIVLEVEDTGIGISETFLPFLFDEFRQESMGLSRSHEGSGLGLAITQRLVRAMSGTIGVRSTRGEGSTFTVRLPRQRQEVPVVSS